ncbi:uncharacterized protein AC631_05052 [Debaryomyces fabryi]|uniref:AAA+ ATPase domain-containing protein n=1 Tax=Debaryomyces fabryi TaxID=58627 RepID=A0A0V1PT17_9ASCO|nr:uncharacterized protein AC631_05052 [Debaryomyces fabryi]KRZ99195.1 hypothetical protein AC631_05052 [Debaryomyces fabryi]CUM55996.1 unnamed protein product [Debaryomyces fabryi]
MFLRRKPPQLPLVEELQLTYNDCCNLTIRNLTLEEHNKVEDALKGWKSLHTSLLFKIEAFDKQVTRPDSEESTLLEELKRIRDENVKHLIRSQLRMDEITRKQNTSSSSKPAIKVTQSSQGSSMTVPSLRGGLASRSLTNTNASNQRRMLKSLRPGVPQQKSLNSKGATQASKAATVSWQKPSNTKVPTIKPVKDDMFEDFDQDSFEFFDSNWERIDSPPNLIDLDAPLNNDNSDSNDYFGQGLSSNGKKTNGVHDASSSMENLTINNDFPKPRISKPSGGQNLKLQPKLSDYASKSTSDIGAVQNDGENKGVYVYNKPKPLNINRLMKGQQLKSQASRSPVRQAPAPKPKPKPQPQPQAKQQPVYKAKPVAKAPQSLMQPPKKSNISYNYIPGNQSTNKPRQNPKKTIATTAASASQAKTRTAEPKKIGKDDEVPMSPTMDDILGGYDDNKPLDEEMEKALKDSLDETDDPNRPLNEDEQAALIASIRGIDPLAATQILNDIVVHGDEVYWDDIVGLESAKNSLKEAVVYPFLRPDLFKGLREPTRGMLLFGPPGTGKTMLARAVATESKSTFFSISSSSLTSKYLGESEKLVKALFLIARKLAPSIVFVDEIDSLLSSRSDGDAESSRRIKNEFLIQWSELSSAAAGRDKDDGDDVSRVLILGATNLPWSIDEAARRRFVRRQYIPLPEDETRKSQIIKLLAHQKNTLLEDDYNELIALTKGFSGSDITALAKDSAMGPLRSLGDKLLDTPTENIRPINLDDFKNSLKYIRPSVLSEGLVEYENWAIKFGSSGV